MVVESGHHPPDATLADALDLMARHRISGCRWSSARGPAGRHPHRPRRPLRRPTAAAGRRADDPQGLVTVARGMKREEARRLLISTGSRSCSSSTTLALVGLITVKDIEKAQRPRTPARTPRAGCASAPPPAPATRRRARRGADRAGVDVIVVDTAHGHSRGVLDAVARSAGSRTRSRSIAGNVATARRRPGAHRRRRRRGQGRIGPGSICTTRIVAGVGVPQLTAILDVARGCRERRAGDRRRRHHILGRPRQGDRGRRGLRHDRLAARRHRRESGEVSSPGPHLQGLSRHGLARRHGARLGRPLFPAGGHETR